MKLAYSAGYTSAIFQIGEFFCKVKSLRVPEATREHTTLEWLHRRSWSFSLPNVIHHTEHAGDITSSFLECRGGLSIAYGLT